MWAKPKFKLNQDSIQVYFRRIRGPYRDCILIISCTTFLFCRKIKHVLYFGKSIQSPDETILYKAFSKYFSENIEKSNMQI